MKQNVILFDNTPEEVEDFIVALRESTGEVWVSIFEKSNGIRDTMFKRIIRYIKYFYFPFKIFLNREKYDKIFCWQQFYGILFAFYSRLFFMKKKNKIFVATMIYNPKNGFFGWIYFKFMKFVLNSDYIDVYSFPNLKHLEYCENMFPKAKNKFVYIPFGVNDFSKTTIDDDSIGKDFILVVGRSNRDWKFLFDSLSGASYNLKILCDELEIKNYSFSSNIEIYNNISGTNSNIYFKNAKCLVIPIKDSQIDGGLTVLVRGLSFGKPIIVTAPSSLSDEYIEDGVNGIAVEKTKENLISAIDKIYSDENFYRTISLNARKIYEREYSIKAYGVRWGKNLI
jgi:glycosyltransferase involved in cell wall biosynthesis